MLHAIRPSDADLVQRTLKGNSEAFEGLVARYWPVANAIAASRLYSTAHAEDAAQEALVRAYQDLDKLREPRKFGAWFVTIVRRTVSRMNSREERERANRPGEECAVYPDPAGRELRNQVWAAVQQLDDDHRDAILLHYFAGRSAREIAGMLDATPAAVRKRLQRAREALGERLLRDLSGEFCPTEDRKKKVMRAVAAAPAGWRDANVGTGATSATAAFTTPFRAAAIAFTVGVVGIGAWVLPSNDSNPNAAPDSARAPEQIDLSGPLPNIPEPAANVTANDTPQRANDDDEAAINVHGTLVDPDGTPVSDAQVVVELKDSLFAPGVFYLRDVHATRVTKSNERGEFAARLPLKRDQAYDVEIHAATANAVGFQRAMAAADHQYEQHWHIEMAPRGAVEGRVFDNDGDPIVDAMVVARTFEPSVPSNRNAILPIPVEYTDAGGAFRFDPLFAGKWTFYVYAEGYAPKNTDHIATGASDAEVVLEPGRELFGVVYDERTSKPVGGLPVKLDSMRRGAEKHQTLTDAAGGYRFTSVGSGEYKLYIEHPEYVVLDVEGPSDPSLSAAGRFISSAGQRPDFVQISLANDRVEFDLPLSRGGVVEGQIFDADTGEGIPGLTVYPVAPQAGRQSAGRHFVRQYSSVETDGKGAFKIRGLLPGEYQLRYRTNGAAPAPGPAFAFPSAPLQITKGTVHRNVDHAIDRSRQFRGRVVDESGNPMPGARITVVSRAALDDGAPLGDTGPSPTTDDTGRFTFYPPETLEEAYLRANKSGWTTKYHGPYRLVGEQREEWTLEAVRSATVSGAVVDAAGRGKNPALFTLTGKAFGPVTTRRVNDLQTGEVQLSPTLSTEHAGAFHLTGLYPDEYVFQTDNNRKTILLGPGETVRDVSFKDHAGAGIRIEGRVTLRGKPAPNVTVSLGRDAVTTKSDGAYVLDATHPTDNGLEASLREYHNGIEIRRFVSAEVELTNDPVQEVDIAVAQGSSGIAGVFYEFGEPNYRGELRLEFERDDGFRESIQVLANESGEYRFDGLAPGVYTVRFEDGSEYEHPIETVANTMTAHDIAAPADRPIARTIVQ